MEKKLFFNSGCLGWVAMQFYLYTTTEIFLASRVGDDWTLQECYRDEPDDILTSLHGRDLKGLLKSAKMTSPHVKSLMAKGYVTIPIDDGDDWSPRVTEASYMGATLGHFDLCQNTGYMFRASRIIGDGPVRRKSFKTPLEAMLWVEGEAK